MNTIQNSFKMNLIKRKYKTYNTFIIYNLNGFVTIFCYQKIKLVAKSKISNSMILTLLN